MMKCSLKKRMKLTSNSIVAVSTTIMTKICPRKKPKLTLMAHSLLRKVSRIVIAVIRTPQASTSLTTKVYKKAIFPKRKDKTRRMK